MVDLSCKKKRCGGSLVDTGQVRKGQPSTFQFACPACGARRECFGDAPHPAQLYRSSQEYWQAKRSVRSAI